MISRLLASVAAVALAALGMTPRLAFTPSALRSYRAIADTSAVEVAACLVGARLMGLVLVTGTVLAEVEVARSNGRPIVRAGRTFVVTSSCGDAVGVVGLMHQHPTHERCWYVFPTTVVGTSDAASASRSPYPVDAILCGDSVVWLFNGKERRERL